MLDLPDSELFRFPVDPAIYLDNKRVIAKPMDFNTVRKKLILGHYETPSQDKNDIQLIYQNALTYTSNKRFKIHYMTHRLSAFSDQRLDSIIIALQFAKTKGKRVKSKDQN